MISGEDGIIKPSRVETRKNSGPSTDRGERYANADRIPGIAPSGIPPKEKI